MSGESTGGAWSFAGLVQWAQALGTALKQQVGRMPLMGTQTPDGEHDDLLEEEDDGEEEFFDAVESFEEEPPKYKEGGKKEKEETVWYDASEHFEDEVPAQGSQSQGSSQQRTSDGGETTSVTPPTIVPDPSPKGRVAEVRKAGSKAKRRILDAQSMATTAEKLTLRAVMTDLDVILRKDAAVLTGADADDAERHLKALMLLVGAVEAACELFVKRIRFWNERVETLEAAFNRACKGVPNEEEDQTALTDLRQRFFNAQSDWLVIKQELEREGLDPARIERIFTAMEDAVEEVLAMTPEQRNASSEEAAKRFRYNDPRTWDVQRLRIVSYADGAVGPEDALCQRIARCEIGDRNGGGAQTGSAMHEHIEGGRGGLSFTYRRIGKTAKVVPVVYNYSVDRNGNDYKWGGQRDYMGGPAPLPF